MKRLLPFFFALIAFAASAQDSTLLAAPDFARKVAVTPGALLIDVRTPQEYGGGHLAGARNIDWNAPSFAQGVSGLDKSAPVFVYCLGGVRSAKAAASLRAQGFTQVYDLDGGIMSWRKAGLPEEGAAPHGLSVAQYQALVTSDKLVLVDFYAEWCGPCKLMKPYLDEIAKEKESTVQVLRIDVDKNPELATGLQISALPTLVLYKEGKVKWWNVGYVPKKTVVKQLK